MKKILFFALSLIAFASCSKEDEGLGTGEDEETLEHEYVQGSLEYEVFVELGLKPSQKDSINVINILEKNTDYYLLGGQRNHQAWFSKLDRNGDEIYCYEHQPLGTWSYSYIIPASFVLKNGDFILLQVFCSSIRNLFDDPFTDIGAHGELLSIIDVSTGNVLGNIGPFDVSDGWFMTFNVIEDHERFLIVPKNHDFSNNKSQFDFYVINASGSVLYNREWTDEEYSTFENGIIFISDEIVAPVRQGDRFWIDYSYPIINLKDWEITYKFDENSGLIPQGNYSNDPEVFYDVDTTYLEGSNIRFIYDEIKSSKNEMSGRYEDKVIGKYSYRLNIDTHEVIFDGEYNK